MFFIECKFCLLPIESLNIYQELIFVDFRKQCRCW